MVVTVAVPARSLASPPALPIMLTVATPPVAGLATKARMPKLPVVALAMVTLPGSVERTVAVWLPAPLVCRAATPTVMPALPVVLTL